ERGGGHVACGPDPLVARSAGRVDGEEAALAARQLGAFEVEARESAVVRYGSARDEDRVDDVDRPGRGPHREAAVGRVLDRGELCGDDLHAARGEPGGGKSWHLDLAREHREVIAPLAHELGLVEARGRGEQDGEALAADLPAVA